MIEVMDEINFEMKLREAMKQLDYDVREQIDPRSQKFDHESHDDFIRAVVPIILERCGIECPQEDQIELMEKTHKTIGQHLDESVTGHNSASVVEA